MRIVYINLPPVLKLLAIICLVIVQIQCRCPDHCSGHGDCVVEAHAHSSIPGGKFLCECWPGYTGLNCKDRTCPYGCAWSSPPFGKDLAHDYVECSGRGECDRAMGLCKCISGAGGQACQKMTCPNQCSGHGQCNLIEQIANSRDPAPFTYNGWDADIIWGCQCDPGYTGGDCSRRTCPRGDDPNTNQTLQGDNSKQYEFQKYEVQRIRLDGIQDISGSFTISYRTLEGLELTTRPIAISNNAFTVRSHLLKATDLGTYGKFSGATYEERTGDTYCPFDGLSCQQECEFGTGISIGDVLVVDAPSQTKKVFTVTSSTPCELTVSPDPATAGIEYIQFTMIKGGKNIRAQGLIGKSGVKYGLIGLPNRVIEDVSVSEDVRHNARKDFKVTFNHFGNAGDLNTMLCNAKGCNIDGCQPRFNGLHKSLGRVLIRSTGLPKMVTSFHPKLYSSADRKYQALGHNFIKIGCATSSNDYQFVSTSQFGDTSCQPFTNILQANDVITFSGTGTNYDQSFSVIDVFSDTTYSNTILVAEEISSFSTASQSYTIDVVRYVDTGNQMYSISIPPGPKLTGMADTFVVKSSTEFTIEGELDFMHTIRIGDEIIVETSTAGENLAVVGKRYEVLGVQTRLIVSTPSMVSLSNSSSSFSIMRPSGSCNVTEISKGSRESLECSGQGVCNVETGDCECFDQYMGTACHERVEIK